MANVTGIQGEREEDDLSEKRFILRGTAQMFKGDDELIIQIPMDSDAPTGRTINGRWKLRIKERETYIGVFSWRNLTEGQWISMTESQWAKMVE